MRSMLATIFRYLFCKNPQLIIFLKPFCASKLPCTWKVIPGKVEAENPEIILQNHGIDIECDISTIANIRTLQVPVRVLYGVRSGVPGLVSKFFLSG